MYLASGLSKPASCIQVINKILFPVDFSHSCRSAARYVEAFAGRFEAEIMLLHVVGMGEHNLAEELLPQRQAQLNAYLADELKYFTTERICVIGDDPAAEIVAAALRWQPDLVMLPTHSPGTFDRLLLGSVTAALLRDLDCPVWTSVHSESVVPLEQIHFRRILCAVDLTERSEGVLNWAASLRAEYDADLGIVHAMAEIPLAVVAVSLEEELQRSVSKQAKEEIRMLQSTAGTAARVFVDSGNPAAVVARVAKNFDPDLLVIGRHQAGPHDDWAILRESSCAVVSI
jgi:nucleotide-binding universal stress UspA family protein